MSKCPECDGHKYVTNATPEGVSLTPCPKCSAPAGLAQGPGSVPIAKNFVLGYGGKNVLEIEGKTGKITFGELHPAALAVISSNEWLMHVQPVPTQVLLTMVYAMSTELARLNKRVAELEGKKTT